MDKKTNHTSSVCLGRGSSATGAKPAPRRRRASLVAMRDNTSVLANTRGSSNEQKHDDNSILAQELGLTRAIASIRASNDDTSVMKSMRGSSNGQKNNDKSSVGLGRGSSVRGATPAPRRQRRASMPGMRDNTSVLANTRGSSNEQKHDDNSIVGLGR